MYLDIKFSTVPVKFLRLDYAGVLVGPGVTFPVYETVSFVFGIKFMPRAWNTFIENDSFC
jgi:hypothetical protein